MILENTEIRSIKLDELKSLSIKQKYSNKIIDNSIEKVSQIPQTELRKSKNKHETLILPFVSTYFFNFFNFLF